MGIEEIRAAEDRGLCAQANQVLGERAVTGGIQSGPKHADAAEQSILGQGVEGGSNISPLPVIALLLEASALAGSSRHCQPGD